MGCNPTRQCVSFALRAPASAFVAGTASEISDAIASASSAIYQTPMIVYDTTSLDTLAIGSFGARPYRMRGGSCSGPRIVRPVRRGRLLSGTVRHSRRVRLRVTPHMRCFLTLGEIAECWRRREAAGDTVVFNQNNSNFEEIGPKSNKTAILTKYLVSPGRAHGIEWTQQRRFHHKLVASLGSRLARHLISRADPGRSAQCPEQ